MIFTLKGVPFVVSFMSFAAVPSTGPAAMQMPGVWCRAGWKLHGLQMVANFPSVYLLQMQQIRFLGIVHPRIVTMNVEDRALVAVAAVLAMVLERRPCTTQIDCIWNVHRQFLTVRAVAEIIDKPDFAFVINSICVGYQFIGAIVNNVE
jgi:hypothetical protein